MKDGKVTDDTRIRARYQRLVFNRTRRKGTTS
ncbi:hypothetical protein ACEQPO_25325 [Bacillus sp. SL00103]